MVLATGCVFFGIIGDDSDPLRLRGMVLGLGQSGLAISSFDELVGILLSAFLTFTLSLSEAFWRDFALTPLPSDALLLVTACFVEPVLWRVLPEDYFLAPSFSTVSLRFDCFFYLEVSLAGIAVLSLTAWASCRVGRLY